MALALQRFDEFDHRIFLRDDRVAAVLAQFFEEAREGRIFEVLCHHGEGKAAEAPHLADELEISEVRCHPHATGFTRLRLDVRLRDVDVEKGLPVVFREPRGPEEIEEGAREGLVGAFGDAAACCVIVLIAKRAAQILQRGGAAAFVQIEGQRADPTRERQQQRARQTRQNPRHSLQGGGFEDVTELLHDRANNCGA